MTWPRQKHMLLFICYCEVQGVSTTFILFETFVEASIQSQQKTSSTIQM